MKIDQTLAQNDYQAAIELINAGILQAKKDNNTGVVHQFKDQLLGIYKKQKDRANIRKISNELFYENRESIKYYRTYKGTFEATEWTEKCAAVIQKLSKDRVKTYRGFAFQSGLVGVYIEEKMWDRLLEEVKQVNNIEVTERYAKYLKNDYPKELITLYENSILYYAKRTGREIYVDIVGCLKNMAKLKGGEEVAQELMRKLLEKYKNRPAMKNEFQKLKWDV